MAQLPHEGPQTAAETVALHRPASPATDGVSHPDGALGLSGHEGYRDGSPPHPEAGAAKRGEGRPVGDGSDQADSRWRPLRRRADRMARPDRVDMRWRNPCLLARLRVFG